MTGERCCPCCRASRRTPRSSPLLAGRRKVPWSPAPGTRCFNNTHARRFSFKARFLAKTRAVLWPIVKFVLVPLFIQCPNNAFWCLADGSGKKSELEEIEEELEALSEKEEDLLARKEEILYPDGQKQAVSKLNGMGVFVLPRLGSEMPDVPPPPPAPAPSVIFDVEMLPPQASQTQCPSCHQFITTEVFTRVGSVAWMVCFMSILFGCVAGCCLLPFCTDTFKDVVHNCPKCRAQIHTNTKL
ncbi:uncharacterized protein [Lepisosteus oculatus]|uniref:uncharacterized protein isoform X1 n=1 Tax=Lepisosteus oculatus TaxID=7918 RepID=UPI00073FF30C|nr:PREDICTED: lipopolysaccharide-induced tumor necrosis factor-alpha factor isoform X1 [Lepisosteus oculatus]